MVEILPHFSQCQKSYILKTQSLPTLFENVKNPYITLYQLDSDLGIMQACRFDKVFFWSWCMVALPRMFFFNWFCYLFCYNYTIIGTEI